MAVLHNIYIRTLNAIYVQAHHIPPSKVRPFLTFCRFWCNMIKSHHEHEEDKFFPDIEKATGVEGIMGENVAQHHKFHDGLERFRGYIADCEEGKREFDGKQITDLIDSFGYIVTEHLADEIPTLLGLRKFPDIDIKKIFDDTGDLALKEAGFWDDQPMMAANCDVTFEGGQWKSFPPIPWIGRLLLDKVASRKYKESWEFATCDMWGQPRELKYIATQKEQ